MSAELMFILLGAIYIAPHVSPKVGVWLGAIGLGLACTIALAKVLFKVLS